MRLIIGAKPHRADELMECLFAVKTVLSFHCLTHAGDRQRLSLPRADRPAGGGAGGAALIAVKWCGRSRPSPA